MELNPDVPAELERIINKCLEKYLEARQRQRAAAEFQKILDHPGIIGNFVMGALVHLQNSAIRGDDR
jgi:hypothetical protein